MGNTRDDYAKEEMSKTPAGQFQGASTLPDVGAWDKLESCEKRCKGGGWVTTIFIFGCEDAEALAGFGSHVNLIIFLTAVMHMENLTAATLLNTFTSLATVTALMGAFVADAYLGRFTSILLGSWINLSGLVVLTVIAIDKTLHPATCSTAKINAGSCERASSMQMGVLYLAFLLMAIGTGGFHPCVTPFGASQFDQAHPEEMKQLKHFFNWWYFSVTTATLLATTVVVYIQDNVGWGLGFGIPAIIFLISIMVFLGGMRFYRYSPPRGSPFTRMAQVIVAAIRKRQLVLPDDPSKLYIGATTKIDESEELEKLGSDKEGDASVTKRKRGGVDTKLALNSRAPAGGGQAAVAAACENLERATVEERLRVEKNADVSPAEKTAENYDVQEKNVANVYDEKNIVVLRHSDQFRFLDKAAIEVDQDWIHVAEKGGQVSKASRNPWKLCPVQQVEELKCMVRLAPMWVTVIPLAVVMAQQHTYIIQQATTMDRHLGHFVIPAASLSTISTITILIWLPLYDKIVIPFLRKYTRNERGITFIQRIGVGIVLRILAELVTALVEHKRREAAAHYGLVQRPHETMPFSAFWLVPQYVIGGLSDSFMLVGHMEFFYHMLPEQMTSTGAALFMTAQAIGTSLSTVSLHVVQKLTQRKEHPGWLDNNINKAHLDYFYGLLTAWLVVDFLIFLVVARWYKRHSHLNQMMGV